MKNKLVHLKKFIFLFVFFSQLFFRVDSFAQSHIVHMQNFTFRPSTITILAGQTVTWINNDSVPHTVTSRQGLFVSSEVLPGRSYSYTFHKPGRHWYYCSIHPQMVGDVIVNI